MRKLAVWTGLCILVLCCALSRGHAQQIAIAGDLNSPEMAMDISLRDADLNEVLTAMFNTTGGKYQLQVGNGVVGRIPRLQLIQTPFDKALDAILGTEYSYTRRQIGNGNYLYTISGRSSTNVPDTGASVPSLAPPTAAATVSPRADSSPSGSATSTSTPATSPTLPTVLTITQKKKDAKPGDAAATETLVVNTIKINNLDIEQLCTALGGTVVKLFVQTQSASGGGMTMPTNNNNNNNNNNGYNNNNNNNNNNNGYNNNYNNNGYNSNGYNNNNYNNGYNNNNNNNNRYSNNNTGYSNNTSNGYNSYNNNNSITSFR